MRILVRAKPNAKEEYVEQINAAEFFVAVKEPPREGRANEAIARALAGYLTVARLRIRLISGFSSRQKVFEIL